MDIVVAAKWLAVTGSVGTLIWFIIIANVHAFVDDPFFAHRGLKSTQVRANLAATATSLAGVLFFFMENTATFGWVLLLIPIFNALGFFTFLHIVGPHDNGPDQTGSIYRFLRDRYSRIQPGRIANVIVLVNLGAIFVIEVVIGTTILGYIIPGLGFQLVFAVILATVAFYYVKTGGLEAVTQTDRWQFYLIIIGFVLAGATLLFLPGGSSVSLRQVAEGVVDTLRNPELGRGFQIAVFFNIVATNISIPVTQISTWERYSATTRDEAISGFKTGIWRFLVPIWFLAILVATLTLVESSGAATGFNGLFEILTGRGGLAALLVFPVLFAALVSALLSTIDSFMLASMLAVTDLKGITSTARKKDDEALVDPDDFGGRGVEQTRRVMRNTGTVLVVAAVSLTWVVSLSPDVFQTITQLLFATYGMPCLLFPLIYYAGRGRSPRRTSLKAAYWGLGLGLAVLIAGSLHGLVTGNFYGTILGPVFGIVIASVGVWISARAISIEEKAEDANS